MADKPHIPAPGPATRNPAAAPGMHPHPGQHPTQQPHVPGQHPEQQPHVPGQEQSQLQPQPGQHPAEQPHDRHHDDAVEANAVAEKPATFTEEQIATPRADAADSRQMYVIVGPYRGSVLTMPNDEAENAKDNHWAIDMADMAPPFDANKPYEHDHELTEEERAYAVKEANEWAAKVNEPPEDPDAPPPEGETEDQRKEREAKRHERDQARRHGSRNMRPEPGRPGYDTRAMPGEDHRKK